MGATRNFLDLDSLFKETTGTPIIINDIPYNGGISGDDLFNSIMTVYHGDTISTVPRCACPDGQGLSGRVRLRHICPICNTPVKEVYEHIESNVWLRAITIDNVTVPFLSPEFWSEMSRSLYGSNRKQGEVDYVRWLCDDKYVLPPNALMSSKHKMVEDLLHNVLGGERNYLKFINNLDAVFQYLINYNATTKKKPGEEEISQIEYLYMSYQKEMKENNGRGIFTEHIPILSKHIFIMENNTKGRYATLKSAINVNVVRSWLNFCYEIKEREETGVKQVTLEKVGREVSKVLSQLTKLYSGYLNDHVFQKSGLIRKHAYGCRSHFSVRSLIVSIEGAHDRRSIEMPWSIATVVYHPHIFSRLVKKHGYSFREADMLLNRSVKAYNELIHKILLEIQSECPDGKPPIIFHRNQMLGSLVA